MGNEKLDLQDWEHQCLHPVFGVLYRVRKTHLLPGDYTLSISPEQPCDIVSFEQREQLVGRTVTYTEELNMIKHLIIKRKVVAWNHVDTSIFLDLPVLQAETFALGQ